MLQLKVNNYSCCWYYKGTNFQANHNCRIILRVLMTVVADTTKVRIFKQITTVSTNIRVWKWLLLILQRYEFSSKSQQADRFGFLIGSCCWYYKGTNFQANHNIAWPSCQHTRVVADTTKVRIFKQITTQIKKLIICTRLLLILQRYEFSSKSQLRPPIYGKYQCCCWYYKGTNFQANHNDSLLYLRILSVVADTTKVRIFKQITTTLCA